MLIAAGRLFPALSSSLIRSNTSTLASTAIPIVRIIPAIEERVKVRLKAERIENIIKRFKTCATTALKPERL